jgi:hypothetical protein
MDIGLIKTLQQEWPTVSAAPWSFAIIFTGALVLGFGVAALLWRGVVSTLRERLNLCQDRLNERNATTVDPASDVSSETASGDLADDQAYNEIVTFSLDALLPACQAQIDYQKELISQSVSNESVRNVIIDGLFYGRRHETQSFLGSYGKLCLGLTESPGPIMNFEGIIDCIYDLERQEYRDFCGQSGKIADAINTNQKIEECITAWRGRHNALIDAYETIKRDSRFGKLFRPARHSRWGDKVPIV